MPRWTEEQLEAINHDNENIIVSAGAGSGKTAVLTERVIRKLKSGIHIDELLVLTFTKAAAGEMKERIRKAIKKDKTLKEELDRIDNAYITTFDSYAYSVVKKYHYLLNISSDVSIIDSSVIYLKKKEILDDLFLELYKKQDSEFLKLIGDFCLKSDADIKNYILTISSKLDLKYDKDEYLDTYLDAMFSNKKIEEYIDEFTNLLISKIKKININLTELSNYVEVDYLDKIHLSLEKLLLSNDYENIKNNLEIRLPNLPKNTMEEAKIYKNNINEIIKELKNICIYSDTSNIKKSILMTKDYVSSIISVIKELDNRINSFKKKNDIYEFIDISKLAIKVLKDNQNIALDIRDSFKEIMIDEYQDTNDLQETFVGMISNNNTYMVGDIKQSIYRFRNANPYIFKEKYDNYSSGINGKKIDLTKNFRSREEVLSDINIIFDLIMHDDIGGADYKSTHRMIFGNTTYENEGKTHQNNHLEIYNYLCDNKDYKKEELEAFIIAQDIKKKVEEKYQVFDKDQLILRDIKYEDFVILMDRTSKFDLYKKIFEYMNIPLMKYTDTPITNEIDILIIKNLLKLIINVKNNTYNEEFKYAFFSIGRSYLFKLSDEELFDCLTNNNYQNNTIMDKVKTLVPFIDNKTSSEMLELIIDKFDFYNNLIKVGSINESIERISYLVELASTLDNLGYGIEDFHNYLDELINSNYDIKLSYSSSSSNSVKIMTIHKSKGLEYHICYFPGMYAKFNISDLKEKILFDNTYGIIAPYLEDDTKDTIYKILMKNKMLKEEVSEKIRLFYVALTRAKEKMIILCPEKENEEYFYKDPINFMSFLDMIKSIKNNLKDFCKEIKIEDLPLSKDYNMSKQKISITKTNKDDKIRFHDLNLLVNQVTKSKYSKENSTIIKVSDKEKMTIGTKIHYLLEVIDFNNPNIDNLDIEDFYKDKLKQFFRLDLDFKNALIYKEYEFIYYDDNIQKTGIIDLMLEYDNCIKIIDYKLKNTSDKAYLEQLTGYKKYISTKTNKDIQIYLYSIIDGQLKEL